MAPWENGNRRHMNSTRSSRANCLGVEKRLNSSCPPMASRREPACSSLGPPRFALPPLIRALVHSCSTIVAGKRVRHYLRSHAAIPSRRSCWRWRNGRTVATRSAANVADCGSVGAEGKGTAARGPRSAAAGGRSREHERDGVGRLRLRGLCAVGVPRRRR